MTEAGLLHQPRHEALSQEHRSAAEGPTWTRCQGSDCRRRHCRGDGDTSGLRHPRNRDSRTMWQCDRKYPHRTSRWATKASSRACTVHDGLRQGRPGLVRCESNTDTNSGAPVQGRQALLRGLCPGSDIRSSSPARARAPAKAPRRHTPRGLPNRSRPTRRLGSRANPSNRGDPVRSPPADLSA